MSSKVNIEKGESSGLQTNLWWCYGKYVVQTAFRLSKNIGKNLTLAICSDEQDKLKSKDFCDRIQMWKSKWKLILL